MDSKFERLRWLFEKYINNTQRRDEFDEMADLVMDCSQEELASVLVTFMGKEDELDEAFDKIDWSPKIGAILSGAKKEEQVIAIPRRPFYRSPLVAYAAAAMLLLALSSPFLIRYFQKRVPSPATAHLQPPVKKKLLPLQQTDCDLVVPTQEQMDADSSIIRFDINGDIHTISVGPGFQFPTKLPDGSDIVLNSASSITYPSTFANNKREVAITGEVYFDVAPVRLSSGVPQPFYVKVKDAQLQVLGTSFNVNAYADNNSFSTTLVTGSLRAIKGKKSALLKPGQQATMQSSSGNHNSDSITITSGDTTQANAWRSGYFSFRQTTTEQALRELSRWYKWQIKYKTSTAHSTDSIPFTAIFCRHSSEEEVLDILRSKGIKFTKTGKKLLITQ